MDETNAIKQGKHFDTPVAADPLSNYNDPPWVKENPQMPKTFY